MERTIAAVLVVMVFLSAVAVIYVKDLNRRMVTDNQDADDKWQQLELKHSQLLLERAALTSPVEVQNIAQAQLGMHQPGPTEIKIVYVQEDQAN